MNNNNSFLFLNIDLLQRKIDKKSEKLKLKFIEHHKLNQK